MTAPTYPSMIALQQEVNRLQAQLADVEQTRRVGNALIRSLIGTKDIYQEALKEITYFDASDTGDKAAAIARKALDDAAKPRREQ